MTKFITDKSGINTAFFHFISLVSLVSKLDDSSLLRWYDTIVQGNKVVVIMCICFSSFISIKHRCTKSTRFSDCFKDITINYTNIKVCKQLVCIVVFYIDNFTAVKRTINYWRDWLMSLLATGWSLFYFITKSWY